MIKRYTRKIMGDIWSDENKYKTWLKVEILACEAMAQIGKIPKKALSNIKKKANFSVKRIDEIEAETKHDVIAFLTNIAEYVGPDSRYIHMGLTSSDILDTSMSYLLRQAGKIILKDCEKFLSTLKKRAFEHKIRLWSEDHTESMQNLSPLVSNWPSGMMKCAEIRKDVSAPLKISVSVKCQEL